MNEQQGVYDDNRYSERELFKINKLKDEIDNLEYNKRNLMDEMDKL